MPFDPAVHHRRSMRLHTYDYSRPGRYFITIDVEAMRCLFGFVSVGEMHLNAAGRMVEKWVLELPKRYCGLQVEAFVVMPNHVHFILHSRKAGTELAGVITWFKTMTTNEYIRGVKQKGWPRFDGRFWQRNYYDHIIRDGKSLDGIRLYIAENPMRWESDGANPECKRKREVNDWKDVF